MLWEWLRVLIMLILKSPFKSMVCVCVFIQLANVQYKTKLLVFTMALIQTKYRILKPTACVSPKWGDTFELDRVSASTSCSYTMGLRKSHGFPFGMDFTL